MEIKVVRKQPLQTVVEGKTITLLFKKQHIKMQYKRIPIVCIYDEKGEYLQSSVNLLRYPKRVPSTLVSQWVNANLAEKLLTLKDRCHTVQRIKDGVVNKYYFTNKEDALYGLHKRKCCENGKTFRVVSIDDSISMQYVVKILNEIGVDIVCEYDKVSNKMLSIKLTIK